MRGIVSFLSASFLFSSFYSTAVQSKLLDKITAVSDGQIITNSTIERVLVSLPARKNIAPQIYADANSDSKQMTQLLVRNLLIRSKLSELGYIIGDDQVEAQIKSTEERLNLGREKLLVFLKENNLSFDEYFELIRESIEHGLFFQKVITPLISITEQDVKNTFYRDNINSNKTLSFRYSLVDFSINKSKIKGNMLDQFHEVIKKLQNEGNLSPEFEGLDTNMIGDITEEGLSTELKDLLKNTDEGSLAKPILIGQDYHVFLIKKKDLVESELFQKAKDQIHEKLFIKQAKDMMETWHQREESKHYVKYFF